MNFFSRRSRAVAGITVLAVFFVVGGAATTALAVSTAWSAPVNISAARLNAQTPRVAVDGSGRATAVWTHYDGSNDIVQASNSLNGGAWSTPVNLSTASQYAADPQVAVDGSGRATAVWDRSDGSNSIVQVSTSLNGAAWSTPVDVSAAGHNAYLPQIIVDGSGLATVVWERFDGSNEIVQASFSVNGAAWSTPINLSTAG